MLIGIVGKPSVGKSSFFRAATLAEVDIANYPFTTIKPNHAVGTLREGLLAKLHQDGYDISQDVKESEIFPEDLRKAIRDERKIPHNGGEANVLNYVTIARRTSTPRIEQVLQGDPNGIFLLERSYISTLLAQLGHSGDPALDSPVKIQDRLKAVTEVMRGTYPIADATIILYCEPRQAYQRVIGRNRTVETGANSGKIGREYDALNRLTRAVPNLVLIDTTVKPDETVEDRVAKTLNSAYDATIEVLKKKGITATH